jgi:hypothetical protein
MFPVYNGNKPNVSHKQFLKIKNSENQLQKNQNKKNEFEFCLPHMTRKQILRFLFYQTHY